MGRRKFSDSATRYILEALIPYTNANLKLSYKPTQFFNELENIDARGRQTYRSAFSRAKKDGYVKIDANGKPFLSRKGLDKVRPFTGHKLGKKAQLMIIFDVPETSRAKRTQLRLLLKELSFVQVQRSVWVTNIDHRKFLKSEIRRMNLAKFVKIYEVAGL